MRSILKWFGILFGGLLGLVALGIALAWLSVSRDLGATWNLPGSDVAVPSDPGAIEEGARLARLRGCFDGCHGDGGSGSIWMEFPDGSQLIAPDLGAIAAQYSDRDFERLLRHGVRPDGSSVLAAMPSSMFSHLSDEDLGNIVAWVRTLPGGGSADRSHFGILGHAMLAYYRHEFGEILAARRIAHDAPVRGTASDEPVERGRYLARTTCTECHGDDFRGQEGFAPSLAAAIAYTPAQFQHLLRTGQAIGGRDLDLMAEIALRRTAYFTDAEIADLHAFLRTLADGTGSGG